MNDLPPWTKINKGDRRPEGRVIVRYDSTDRCIFTGEELTEWRVCGAWWNPKRQQWIADHGRPVSNVTHYMPMPEGFDT